MTETNEPNHPTNLENEAPGGNFVSVTPSEGVSPNFTPGNHTCFQGNWGFIARALAKVQGRMSPIRKREESVARGGREYRYAKWDDILIPAKEELSQEGISLSQTCSLSGVEADRSRRLEVETWFSGGEPAGRIGFRSAMALPAIPEVRENLVTLDTSMPEWASQRLIEELAAPNPQVVGAAVPYEKRYALISALGIALDEFDDDGRVASGIDRPPASAPSSGGWPHQSRASVTAPRAVKSLTNQNQWNLLLPLGGAHTPGERVTLHAKNGSTMELVLVEEVNAGDPGRGSQEWTNRKA